MQRCPVREKPWTRKTSIGQGRIRTLRPGRRPSRKGGELLPVRRSPSWIRRSPRSIRPLQTATRRRLIAIKPKRRPTSARQTATRPLPTTNGRLVPRRRDRAASTKPRALSVAQARLSGLRQVWHGRRRRPTVTNTRGGATNTRECATAPLTNATARPPAHTGSKSLLALLPTLRGTARRACEPTLRTAVFALPPTASGRPQIALPPRTIESWREPS